MNTIERYEKIENVIMRFSELNTASDGNSDGWGDERQTDFMKLK